MAEKRMLVSKTIVGGMCYASCRRRFTILQPAGGTDADESERRRAIDEMLEEVLREKPSNISAGKLLEESRR